MSRVEVFYLCHTPRPPCASDFTIFTTMVKDISYFTKILAKHLKKLSVASLEVFITALCSLEAPHGCKQIQSPLLEGKTAKDVAEIIIRSYTIRHGPAKIKQALKNINENQIRIDLQKDFRGASQSNGGQTRVAGQKKNEGARKNSMFIGSEQPQGCATGQKTEKGQQPGDDIKPKPKRARKPTESKALEKSTVKAQTQGGAACRKRAGQEQSEEAAKPKRTKKQSATGGQTKVAGQKKNEGARKNSMLIGTEQPQGSATGQKTEKGQQPGEDIKPKPKRARKPTDKKHFVIKNRNSLIKSITLVEPILDDLLEKELLTQEQYNIIRKKPIIQDKMRELYDFVRSWGVTDNDIFLEILKTHNPIIIKNLTEKSNREKK
ncbi:uncharacterized protein LOC142656049 isoform X2 [Rhinoderma darwinii]|uniref:uncharacterized protein LOC142656049 isoform X2 n=1 Tax=Rhinoderma darwinii TaxID=43563 RepID=UPI003F66FB47